MGADSLLLPFSSSALFVVDMIPALAPHVPNELLSRRELKSRRRQNSPKIIPYSYNTVLYCTVLYVKNGMRMMMVKNNAGRASFLPIILPIDLGGFSHHDTAHQHQHQYGRRRGHSSGTLGKKKGAKKMILKAKYGTGT
jgi:hypothetical protein